MDILAVKSKHHAVRIKRPWTRIAEINREFAGRFERIIAGTYRTPPKDLFEPVAQIDCPCDTWMEIGTITDLRLKELFSYARELSEKGNHLRWPRRSKERHSFKLMKDAYFDLSKMVDDYFWVMLSAKFPKVNRLDRIHLVLCVGWKVMLHRHPYRKRHSAAGQAVRTRTGTVPMLPQRR